MTTTTDHSLNADVQAGAIGHTTDPDPEVPERARGPRRYSAGYKARILAEYEGFDGSGTFALIDGCRFHALARICLRSRSKFARPYICRLIILTRLTLPSTVPELQGLAEGDRVAVARLDRVTDGMTAE